MKREVEREVRLSAFNLHMGDLELLWGRVVQLFEPTEKIKTSISLSLPSERLEFDSFEEMKQYRQLRGRVTNFSIEASQGNKSVLIRTGGLFSNVPTLKAKADSDVWCAGAVEAVMSVIRSNKVWYFWFIQAPIGFLFMLSALAPYIRNWLVPNAGAVPLPLAIAWITVAVVLGFLAFTKEKLLPPATITFTSELGFIRRYGSELGLLLGLVSLILAVYTWLSPYVPNNP